MTHASAGQHWYAKDGTPTYEVPSADGKKMVKATLRQARKLELVPGVTGIMGLMDKPALTQWKMRQAILAALTLPRQEGESDDAYVARIIRDGMQEAADARDMGTRVHIALQEAYSGRDPEPDLVPWVEAIFAITDKLGPREMWTAEKPVANHWGYGTKADLSCPSWVLDFKGKDDLTDKSLVLYDEHYMQLSATREALEYGSARCGIIFFSRNKPEARLVEADPDELQRGLDMFQALTALWQHKNRYFPGWGGPIDRTQEREAAIGQD